MSRKISRVFWISIPLMGPNSHLKLQLQGHFVLSSLSLWQDCRQYSSPQNASPSSLSPLDSCGLVVPVFNLPTSPPFPLPGLPEVMNSKCRPLCNSPHGQPSDYLSLFGRQNRVCFFDSFHGVEAGSFPQISCHQPVSPIESTHLLPNPLWLSQLASKRRSFTLWQSLPLSDWRVGGPWDSNIISSPNHPNLLAHPLWLPKEWFFSA